MSIANNPNRGERAWTTDAFEHDDTANVGVKRVGNYIWNTSTLEWEKATETTLYKQIEEANDNVTTINYADATKADVATIVKTSASVGYTSTETYDNSGATTLVITRAVV